MSDVTEQQAVQRVQQLVADLDRADAASAESARELLQVVLDLHARGLNRMLEIVAGATGGHSAIERFATDEQISGLLLLHDLHPQDLETRVRAAIQRLRPHLAVRGIGVAAVEFGDGSLRLTLHEVAGSGGLEPPTLPVLQRELEESLFGVAPDLAALEVIAPNTVQWAPVRIIDQTGTGAAAHG